MKDILSSLRLQIYERLSSPLFGSFVVAWVCWNHRLLTILFSTLPVTERFHLIDTVHFPTTQAAWLIGFAYPMASALAFIFIYPFPSKWILAFWLKRQNELKKLRDEIEGQVLLTKKESQAIKSRALESNLKNEATIQQLRDELETAKEHIRKASEENANDGDKATLRQSAELADANTRIAELEGLLEASKKSVEPAQLEEGPHQVIKLLAEKSGSMKLDSIFRIFPESRVRTQHYLDETRDAGYTNVNVVNESVYLTPKGREYAVANKFV